MNLTAISVDDEPRAHTVIRHYADKIDQLELVESFTSPLKAVSFLKENQVDIIFLDINMPDMDGMSLLKTLKDVPAIIFTTAYDEYAVESYDHDAVGYLLKPIEFPKFYKAVMRVMDLKQTYRKAPNEASADKSEALLLKSGTKLLSFSPDDIRYIEASGNYAELYLENDHVLVDHTLSDLINTLLPPNFIRIHRSTVINRDYLQEYETHQVVVAGTTLGIGKTFRKEIKKIIIS